MSKSSNHFPSPTLQDVADFQLNEQPLPEDAFSPCPMFISANARGLKEKDKCRHLCANRCYFNSFQPIRFFCTLSKTIRECGLSPRSLLRGWSVSLEKKKVSKRKFSDVASGDEEDFLPSSSSSSSTSTTNPWFVVLISPSHRRFTSIKSVLAALHIDGSSPYNESSSSALCSELLQSPSWRDVDSDSGSQKLHSLLHPPITAERVTSSLVCAPSSTSPMISPFGLLEELFVDDPWKLLVSCIFLNRTSREQADPALHSFLTRWPTLSTFLGTPLATLESDLQKLLRPLGMHKRRTASLIAFSRAFSELTPADKRRDEDIKALTCVGTYGLSAYKIFARGDEAKDVGYCGDYAIDLWLDWRRAKDVETARNNDATRC